MQALSNYSNVGVPGRFIFRIDEWIQPAGCADIDFDQKSDNYFKNIKNQQMLSFSNHFLKRKTLCLRFFLILLC